MEQLLGLLTQYLTRTNIIVGVCSLGVGIVIGAKMGATEAIALAKVILPNIFKAETTGKDNTVKAMFVDEQSKNELPLSRKVAKTFLFGTMRNTVETVFKNIAVPVIKSALLRKIK